MTKKLDHITNVEMQFLWFRSESVHFAFVAPNIYHCVHILANVDYPIDL